MVNDFLNLPKKVADGAGFEPVYFFVRKHW